MKAQSCRSSTRQYIKWSHSEVNRLRRLYPKNSNHEIARRLGHSFGSVLSKAFKLGLKKDPARLVRMGKENIAHRWGSKPKTLATAMQNKL